MKALVIDDDPGIAGLVEGLVDPTLVEVVSAASASEGWAILERLNVDVLILDDQAPDARGLDLLGRVRELDPRLPTLFLTAEETSDAAIEAMTLGAFDCLAKPIDRGRLQRQIVAALEHRRLMRTPVELAPTRLPADDQSDSLVGRCSAMQEVFRSLGRFARQSVPVLLVGETGVGKELAARTIYRHGDRAGRPFLKVNCSDHSEERLEVELFGEERDDRDGVGPRRVGKLEQCDGGTLLLEETGALPPSTQRKLLRVLRHGVYERIGGDSSLRTDVRLIFTAVREPAELVRSGRLREDLYYSLSAYEIRIPPLRDRGDDLRLLTERFVARHGDFGRGVGGGLPRVSEEAYELLGAYRWPGNVSELQAVLRRALIESKGAVLASDFLKRLVQSSPPTAVARADEIAPARSGPPQAERTLRSGGAATTDWRGFVGSRLNAGSETIYDEAIEEMERHALSIVLTHTGGNQAKAAKLLGMTRTSLRKKILALGIRLGPYLASSRERE